MREKIRNLIVIIKDNSKIIVPSIVIIMLLIVLFITLYFYKYNHYRNDEELDFYHYVTASKEEFKATISRNRRSEVVGFDTGKDMVIDSYPIYSKDNKLVVFPSKMNIVYATNELKQYKSLEYSYLSYRVNDYMLIDQDFQDCIKHSFLYDGNNLYFFLDSVNITIGNDKIELSPLSFVVANPNNNINYYDKDSDTYKSIDTKDSDIMISNDYYKINVMEDKLDYYGNNVLLINDLDYLKHIGKEE